MGIEDDAVSLVRYLVSYEERPNDPNKGRHVLKAKRVHTSAFTEWSVDRFNDAISEAEDQGWLEEDETLGSTPYATNTLAVTRAGRKRVERQEPPARHAQRISVDRDGEELLLMLLRAEEARAGQSRLGTLNVPSLAKSMDWTAERMNRAIELLDDRGLLKIERRPGTTPFRYFGILANARGLSEADRLRELVEHEEANSEEDSEEHAMQPDPTKVFIIHGRNVEAAKQMGIYLASLGLSMLDFDELKAEMGGSVSVSAVVLEGMKRAQGVIALFTPDEYSALRPDMRQPHDKPVDIQRWQARPNVLFEAGMAFHRDPKRVVFVLLGNVELFSDVHGIVIIHLDDSPTGGRAKLRNNLAGGMGCAVNTLTNKWQDHGDFASCVRRLPEVSPRDPFDRATSATTKSGPS